MVALQVTAPGMGRSMAKDYRIDLRLSRWRGTDPRISSLSKTVHGFMFGLWGGGKVDHAVESLRYGGFLGAGAPERPSSLCVFEFRRIIEGLTPVLSSEVSSQIAGCRLGFDDWHVVGDLFISVE